MGAYLVLDQYWSTVDAAFHRIIKNLHNKIQGIQWKQIAWIDWLLPYQWVEPALGAKVNEALTLKIFQNEVEVNLELSPV